ncbi:hypothetical protein DS909_01430 [Phaeobacter gallaeciensis]|uniref:Uncharacterized protein n=1 Tax=Phaeobacter gallaeciensis TaxID=60890 RepID=A0A366XEP1_9RHOB|nr:hypothetical protein DS909_01430 [Phaeobacter gallaeciensis]
MTWPPSASDIQTKVLRRIKTVGLKRCLATYLADRFKEELIDRLLELVGRLKRPKSSATKQDIFRNRSKSTVF